MSNQSNNSEPEMIPVDVRITDVTKIPAKYFVHDEILQALHRVIRSDVVVHGNPVPPGADAVFKPYTMSAARERFSVANQDLAHQLKRLIPSFIVLWIAVAGAVVVAWFVWGALNG